MRVLGVDYSFGKDNMSVSMCGLSNENSKGGIDLENISTFKVDKDYDLASLIVNQVNNLNVQYVVVDSFGVGTILYCELRKILGEKVIGHRMSEKNDHELLNRLTECPLLEKLGLKLHYKVRSSGYVNFDLKKYKNLEYLQVRSLALANYYILEKLLTITNDEKECDVNDYIRDISAVYIKDGIIIKDRCGIIRKKINYFDIMNIIKKEKGIITIQEKDEIRSYTNGERIIIFG